MRASELPLDRITWLLALLIVPWTFKFLWAPLVDAFRGPRWNLRHWVVATQCVMIVSLIPLLWLDLVNDFETVSHWLLLHAFAASTQDVAIDALCIQSSQPDERASLNGWMQCGMLSGRALMGGGSLILEAWIGFRAVVGTLMFVIGMSLILVWTAREPHEQYAQSHRESAIRRVLELFRRLIGSSRAPIVWAGLVFALLAPAAFKSLEAVIGPFLIDRGYDEINVGSFTATFMIGAMIVGSLLAGSLAERFLMRRFLVGTLLINLTAIGVLAIFDWMTDGNGGSVLLAILTIVALSIGMLTVAMYAWLMNLTDRALAATQFTLFMAATNASEAWSTTLFGQLQVRFGYPASMAILCMISAFVLVVPLRFRPPVYREPPLET
jgi:MFS family permease